MSAGSSTCCGIVVGLVGGAVALGALLSGVLASRRKRAREFEAAQEALLVSEERLRLALEATSDVIWDWDVVRDTIYHPGWAKAYGFPEEKTPRNGHELGPYMHPDDAPGFGALLGDLMGGKRDSFEFEHRALYGTGEWRWTIARARAVARDAQGHATRIIGTCADVTERRKMIARLQMADRLASVGTLAAGVAHEINNPLAYVLGNVQHSLESLDGLSRALAQGEPVAGEVGRVVGETVEALREAATGAERVRDIVRDLKVFSRASSEERRPTSVASVLQSAGNLAGPEIRHRARFRLELAELPPVMANESRLSQVFLNLLVNAAQAIPAGHPEEHEIVISGQTDREGRAVVEVRDTGCGIALADQKRIFDPFFTTKPAGEGTGLGLAICHGIVTGLGGEIDVESAPGRGTTFRVTLPATGEPVRPEEPVAARSQVARARVLLVDDEPGFCKAAERMLGEEHDVFATTDPFDALRRIEAGEPFDVLLTDVVMPHLTGIELHALVQKCAPALAGRTLFVTGGAVSEGVADFLAERKEMVVEKPCGARELRDAIAAVLRGPRVSAA